MVLAQIMVRTNHKLIRHHKLNYHFRQSTKLDFDKYSQGTNIPEFFAIAKSLFDKTNNKILYTTIIQLLLQQ